MEDLESALPQEENGYLNDSLVQPNVLEAQHVYLLMRKDKRISTNVRAQWFLSNINNVIEISSSDSLKCSDEDLLVLSVIPNDKPAEWSPETCTWFKYKLLPTTSVTILSQSYRIVFCLDLSPSALTVNSQSGNVMWDEAIIALKKCLDKLTLPFHIPGSKILFTSQIYITVIAHTSSNVLPNQQVLFQGCLLTADNHSKILDAIQTELNTIETNLFRSLEKRKRVILSRYSSMTGKIVDSSVSVYDAEVEIDFNVFPGNKFVPASERSFINLFRYGILSLQLLPDNTTAGIVVITDGVVSLPDVQVFQSLLEQLRNSTISCSFLNLSPERQADCSWGYLPNVELMKFISLATFGSYIPITSEESEMCMSAEVEKLHEMNMFHHALLTWSFQWESYIDKLHFGKKNFKNELQKINGTKFVPNQEFVHELKTHADKQMPVSPINVISCRLREGYRIQNITLVNDKVQVDLLLPWKPNVNIIYQVTASWPLDGATSCQYAMNVAGNYDFIHDLSCPNKKPIRSTIRAECLKRFVDSLQTTLINTDGMLVHLHSVCLSPAAYGIPENLRNKRPLFCYSSDALMLYSNDFPQHRFTEIWEPIITRIDMNTWQKWMHTHRIGVILAHDTPLPKRLHMPNNNDRYQPVQFRHSLRALTTLLDDHCSFILVENSTYITFIYGKDNEKPISLYIIRLITKVACVIIRFAFVSGTTFDVRNKIVQDLRKKILSLKMPRHPSSKNAVAKRRNGESNREIEEPLNYEKPCCVAFQKPLEKITIRYERVPHDLTYPVGKQVPNRSYSYTTPAQMTSINLYNTLSRYFYHRRCIWSTTCRTSVCNSILGCILQVLVQMRLDNGFCFGCFSCSSSGILNMVYEVMMAESTSSEEQYPCVIQYLIFPPYVKSHAMNSFSEDDFDDDNDNDDYDGDINTDSESLAVEGPCLVTECWIEPQHGLVVSENSFLKGLTYKEIPKLLWEMDRDCILSLLTFEHLNKICRSGEIILPEERTFPVPKWIENDGNSYVQFFQFPFFLNVLLSNCTCKKMNFPTITYKDLEENRSSSKLLLKIFHESLKSFNTCQLLLSDAEHKACHDEYRRQMDVQDSDVDMDCQSPRFSRWRCYIKKLSMWHLIVTVIPDTYEDIVILGDRLDGGSDVGIKYSFPFYVYDCSLTGISKRLLNGKDLDFSSNFHEVRPNSNSGNFEIPLHLKMPDEKIISDRRSHVLWDFYVQNVKGAFSNSFVSSIYLSLLLNRSVNFEDVRYAIQHICKDTVVQIDLTDFLQTICYHSHHWPPKDDYQQSPDCSEFAFPKTFWSSFSCQSIKNVHDLIRKKFKSIVQRRFTPVASDAGYYYFHPEKQTNNISALSRENSINSNYTSRTDDQDVGEGDFDTFPDDENDTIGVDSNLKNFNEAYDRGEVPYPPLFLHFNCSVKHNDFVTKYPVNTLPTCFCDVLKSCADEEGFGNYPSVNPRDVTVLLDIICQTRPSEEWTDNEETDGDDKRGTSFCSSSPGPQDLNLEEGDDDTVIDFCHSDECNSESQVACEYASWEDVKNHLFHLLDDQQNALKSCIEDVKWMLNDEITSFARDVYPITANNLENVADHVSHSDGRDGCIKRITPISFVFSAKQCLKQFEEEFQRMNSSCYQLVHEGEYYYVAKRKTAIESLSKTISEKKTRDLVSKHFLMHSSSHSGDVAEFRPILTVDHSEDRKTESSDVPSDASGMVNSERRKISERSRNLSKRSTSDGENEDPTLDALPQRKVFPPGRRRKKSLQVSESSVVVDGYEGDGSDFDNEVDIQGNLDGGKLELPPFWLVLKITSESVVMWFQYRSTEVKDSQCNPHEEIIKQLVNHIKDTCKVVNQSRLLQDLHDSRMCNSLLESETNEDGWRQEEFGSVKSSRRVSTDGLDTSFEKLMDTFDINIKAPPGLYSCPVVWKVHFILHPRIKTHASTSRGVQALRSVLSRMSVTNRKNMFVYKDSIRGVVHYLRLHDSQSSVLHNLSEILPSTSKSIISEDENISQLSSRSSSIQSLNLIKPLNEPIEEIYPRYRINSLDKDPSHDNVSVSSRLSISGRSKTLLEDTVSLSVHGICEVGSEINDDLVRALQSRLDDAVLEVVSVMLSRNPMCKLTVEDVQFIQRPNEPPKSTVYFKVAPHALPFLQVVAHYLSQNLIHFLSIPKYNDGRHENQFRRYPSTTGSNDTHRKLSCPFLYTRPPEAGNRGIACVIMSLVDGQGNLVQHVSCPRPTPSAYKDGLTIHDFDPLTEVEIYTPDASKTPGAIALIEFQIWEQGKVDVDNLLEKLRMATRQSLWDLITEYRVLVAPVSISLIESTSKQTTTDEESIVASEPSTPVRIKRTSLPFDGSSIARERAASPLYLLQSRFREMSSSVPDVNAKCRSPHWSLKNLTPTFVSQQPSSPLPQPQSFHPLRGGALEEEMTSGTDSEWLIRKQEGLHSLYSTMMVEWLSYALPLGVPSVSRNVCNFSNVYSVDFFLRDLQRLVAIYVQDSFLKVFKKGEKDSFFSFLGCPTTRDRRWPSGTSYTELSSEAECPGRKNHYIAICRNLKQWKICSGYAEKDSTIDTADSKDPTFKSYNELQRFTPLSHTLDGRNSTEESRLIFIPRQRLLMVSIVDREISILIYNWSIDVQSNFLENVNRFIDNCNVRSCFLTSIVFQKIGLFSNQPVIRTSEHCRVHPYGTNDGPCKACKCAAVDVEILTKRLVVQSGQTRRSSIQMGTFIDALKDNQPKQPMSTAKSPGSMIDPVTLHVTQLFQIRSLDPRDFKKRMLMMWQSREPRPPVPVMLLKQFSRLEHYCLTPLLFHPCWRNQVAAARDYTVTCLPSLHQPPADDIADQLLAYNEINIPTPEPEPSSGTRSRHSSTTATPGKLNLETKQARKVSGVPLQNWQPTVVYRNSPGPHDEWHVTMLSNYIGDFVQYLQTLGFVLCSVPPRQVPSTSCSKDAKVAMKVDSNSDDPPAAPSFYDQHTHYLQKTLLGGVILLELSVQEPYFGIMMYTFESQRLKALEDRSYNSQFMVAFIDECDKTKVSLHLHSFTYDYHLRSMQAYISGRNLALRHGYHAIGFLDDFLKYYQKPPSFARNLIYTDIITKTATSVPGEAIYVHLLKSNKQYDLRKLKMTSLDEDDEDQYVLVHMTTEVVERRDVIEGGTSRIVEEFDVSFVTTNDDGVPQETYSLQLKYFAILTSCREMFPRPVPERLPGSFKSILSIAPPTSNTPSRPSSRQTERINLELSNVDIAQVILNSSINDKSLEKSMNSSSSDFDPDVKLIASSFNGMVGSCIRQEKVNYLAYYSNHEDIINDIMMKHVLSMKTKILNVLQNAMIDCFRDFCWERLLRNIREPESSKRKEPGSCLSFAEFNELLNLVYKVPLTKFDTRLDLMVKKMPLSWYHSLTKLLTVRYPELHRWFTAADNVISHLVILDPDKDDIFFLLSVDLAKADAELRVVSLTEPNLSFTSKVSNLLEMVINTCCFHMWQALF